MFDAVICAGYPRGVPRADHLPLLALLRRRLPDNAAAAVAARLDINAAAICAAHRPGRRPTAGGGRSGARAAPTRRDHRIGPTARLIGVRPLIVDDGQSVPHEVGQAAPHGLQLFG
ncbi:DUF3349 domain-containing protein [Mycobacterium tilburgii]|uniref:DUF3349 domain-containing protein n=1 Tax=Mycobacterium tilburgii TaxID=44467 RepID=UPI001182C6D9|nr:DUF3349 domain-containing protein [Mycobacterium tilburgii]